MFWLWLITEGAPSRLQQNSSLAFRNHLIGSPSIFEINYRTVQICRICCNNIVCRYFGQNWKEFLERATVINIILSRFILTGQTFFRLTVYFKEFSEDYYFLVHFHFTCQDFFSFWDFHVFSTSSSSQMLFVEWTSLHPKDSAMLW